MNYLKELKLNPSNPRIIKDEEFKRLVDSIRKFPKMLELRPIVYNKDNIILGGNMRFRALQTLAVDGFEVKDAYFKSAESLTEQEVREFVIKDNLPSGSWDWEALSNEWSDLPLADWGLDVSKWGEDNNQPSLDQTLTKDPIVCPQCGHEFHIKKND